MGDYPIGRAVTGEDHTGAIRDAHVHIRGGHQSLLVLEQPFLQFNAAFKPFLNATEGIAMNKNGGFGGTPIHVHDGTDDTVNEWTGTNIGGSGVTFDSTAQANTGTKSVLTDNETAGNEWQFAKGSNQDLTGYTAITMFVFVDEKWGVGDSVQVQGFDVGVGPVGDAVLIEDYFDQFEFDVWHKVSITFNDMGLTGLTIDAFRFEIVSKESSGPKWYMDDLQIEQTGDPIVYTSQPDRGEIYHVDALRFTMADADTNIVTVAGDTENATLPGLSYNKLLGVSALGNGIVFQRTQDNKVNLVAAIRQLSQFLALGFDILNAVSDGTNTVLNLEVAFQRPFILDGSSNDKMTFTITDDLSGLLMLTATARGAVEI